MRMIYSSYIDHELHKGRRGWALDDSVETQVRSLPHLILVMHGDSAYKGDTQDLPSVAQLGCGVEKRILLIEEFMLKHSHVDCRSPSRRISSGRLTIGAGCRDDVIVSSILSSRPV